MKTTIVSAFLSLLLTGCASTPYNYHQEPSPLKPSQSRYYIQDLDMTVSANRDVDKATLSRFAPRDELKALFQERLVSELKERGIYADSIENADADLNITLHYTRNHIPLGAALAKPEFSHELTVEKDGKLLLDYNLSRYTTKYSYLKDGLVNLKIATLMWGPDNESEDLDVVAKALADDIERFGK